MPPVRLKDGQFAHIRRAAASDAVGLVALMNRCYQERLYYHTSTYDTTPEQLASLIERDLHVVADVDGALAGWAEISPGRAEFMRHTGNLGMGIDRSYRDAGLGRHLLLAVLDLAREASLERVTLYANASNARALALYEKVGFVQEGRLRREIKDSERYDDVVIMGLLF